MNHQCYGRLVFDNLAWLCFRDRIQTELALSKKEILVESQSEKVTSVLKEIFWVLVSKRILFIWPQHFIAPDFFSIQKFIIIPSIIPTGIF